MVVDDVQPPASFPLLQLALHDAAFPFPSLFLFLFSPSSPANKFPYPAQYSPGSLNVHLIVSIHQSQSHTAWQFSKVCHPFVQYELARTSPFSRFIICLESEMDTKLYTDSIHAM